MGKLATLLTATAVLTLVMGPLSATSSAQEAQDATMADEKTIRSLEEQERLGVLNQDFEALERIWSEHFTVNAPTNRVSPSRSAVLDIFRQGLVRYSSFDRRIEHIRLDGDLAIVMGAETVQPIGNAPLAGKTVERRFTHVWVRHGETWRLARATRTT